MDSFFGIGPLEFLLILVIAGLVLGPERMIRTAYSTGKLLRQLQTMTRALSMQLQRELHELDRTGEIKEAAAGLREVQKTMTDVRQEVKKIGAELLQEGTAVANQLNDEVNTIHLTQPPAHRHGNGNGNGHPAKPAVPSPTELPKPAPVPDDEP